MRQGQCSTVTKAAVINGSISRKLWTCCSMGLTARRVTAWLTSHRAVASCARKATIINTIIKELISKNSAASSGSAISPNISRWIRDSFASAVDSILAAR